MLTPRKSYPCRLHAEASYLLYTKGSGVHAGDISALDVWSRSLVVGVLGEPRGLVHPGFADSFVGREAA